MAPTSQATAPPFIGTQGCRGPAACGRGEWHSSQSQRLFLLVALEMYTRFEMSVEETIRAVHLGCCLRDRTKSFGQNKFVFFSIHVMNCALRFTLRREERVDRIINLPPVLRDRVSRSFHGPSFFLFILLFLLFHVFMSSFFNYSSFLFFHEHPPSPPSQITSTQ